ncbi:MAG: hypothetical protein ABIR76_08695 [Polaromonas sp.]
MQRRTLLKLGAASAAVLVLAGGGAALLRPGLAGGALSSAGRDVFAAVGRGVLDTTLPAEAGPREIALQGLLNRVDILVQSLPPHAQGELSQLLALLASVPGRLALARLTRPWPEAAVAEIQQALQEMRLSSLALRQQAYAALHDITAGAYFAAPSSWAMLGYPGPSNL